jgi:hypothetical protein
VRAGEHKLEDLAKRLGHDLNALMQANPQIPDFNNLKPGQDINLPQTQVTAPTMQVDMSQPSAPSAPNTMQIDMSKEPQTGGPVMFRAGEASARSVVQMRMNQAAPAGPPSGGNTPGAKTPMPSPEGVPFYTGYPDKTGKLVENRGWTDVGAKWLQDAYQLTKDHAKQSKELQTAINNFDAAAANGQKKIDAAMKKDVPKGVEKLNAQTNGEVGRLTREYKSEREQAAHALKERGLAATEADAALIKHGIAESNIQKRALEIEKQHLGKQAADLQGEIDGNKELVDKAYDMGKKVATGDLKGLAEDVLTDITKGLVSNFLSVDAKAQLALVKARMDAVDEKLNSVTDKTLRDELMAAKKTLQASAKKIVLAEDKYKYHANQADQKLDQLVSHEKRFNTTTIFRETRDYNTSMTRAGNQLWQESGETLRMMNRRTIMDAKEMHGRIEADRKHVNTSDAPPDAQRDFMIVSGQMQEYAKKLESWRKDQQPELDKLKVAQQALSQGKHMTLVDSTMDTIVNKGLDGVDLRKDRDYMQRQ